MQLHYTYIIIYNKIKQGLRKTYSYLSLNNFDCQLTPSYKCLAHGDGQIKIKRNYISLLQRKSRATIV